MSNWRPCSGLGTPPVGPDGHASDLGLALNDFGLVQSQLADGDGRPDAFTLVSIVRAVIVAADHDRDTAATRHCFVATFSNGANPVHLVPDKCE